ncbi:MAG: DNA polymerase III subunit gamma/tau [bacterium]
MKNVTLYRKYRPQNFSQVIGQDLAIRIITNSILNNTFSHAYLFTGTRGTGKTTVARIFAKALNCLQRVDFEPCNNCSNCISINNNNFPDCIEIDAASNRGINEIKQIRENIKLAPLKGKYKVYIIDEVHMLTIEAFNALLKSLEEPPEFTVFILATTDIHKVPITIQSRCQKIEFKRVHHSTIFQHLKEICNKEKINIDEEALMYLSKVANGSVRDSLSILEQVRNMDKKISINHIFQISLTASYSWIYEYLFSILQGNISDLIQVINKIKYNSVNIYQFLYTVLEELRNIIYFRYNQTLDEFCSFQIENYQKITSFFPLEKVRRVMNVVSNVLNYYKSENDYIFFEIMSLNLGYENYTQDQYQVPEKKIDVENRFNQEQTNQDYINVKEQVLKFFENDKLIYKTMNACKEIIKQGNKIFFVYNIQDKYDLTYIKLLEQKREIILEKLKQNMGIENMEIKEVNETKMEKVNTKNTKNSIMERVIDYTKKL